MAGPAGRRRIHGARSHDRDAHPAAARRRDARGDRGGDRPDRAQRRLPTGNAARKSPGQLASHYAPAGRCGSDATSVAARRGPARASGPRAAGRRADPQSQPLRRPHRGGRQPLRPCCARSTGPSIGRIAVMPIPQTGLGLAINDRLRRAAADDGSGRQRLSCGKSEETCPTTSSRPPSRPRR